MLLVVSSVDPVNIFPAVASDVLRKLCVQELHTLFAVLVTCHTVVHEGQRGRNAGRRGSLA